MEDNIEISVVSPVYMAENIVDALVDQLEEGLINITNNYEIILVEDGGKDNSWDRILLRCQKNKRVKGIKLSRNFGQHHAITAGLDHCSGKWVVVMDCDLQDRPEEIINFYTTANKGYDIVIGRIKKKKDSLIRRIENMIFYGLYNYLVVNNFNHSVGNFGIYSRKVIKSYLKYKEDFRSFGIMINNLGFKRIEIEISQSNRLYGKSSYTFKKKISLALDTIISNSDKALKTIIFLGFIFTMSSIILFVVLVLKSQISGTTVLGWSSIIITICFSLGVLVSCIGVVGIYIGKIFIQVKNRPVYIIDKET